MAIRRMHPIVRIVGAAVVAAAAAIVALTGRAHADDRRFDVTGTVLEFRGDLLTVLTSDLIGRPQPITVDVSLLPGLQITPDTPIQLTIVAREYDSFLALGLVRESPFVNGAEFGVREEFTVRQDSIAARVGNVSDDDEALAQQHRTNDLRHRDRNEDDGDEKRNRR